MIIFSRQTQSGFTLVEMIVSMAIIGIIFLSLSTFITRFLQERTKASEFVQVQDHSFIHVEMLSGLVKSAKNAFAFPENVGDREYRFDTLLLEHDEYSDAPFALVKAFEKNIAAQEGTVQKLDELYAANKDIEKEYYMAISSLYPWSDVVGFDDLGERILYSDPASGTLKILDVTLPKPDAIAFAKIVNFGEAGNFRMPSGLAKKNVNTFYVSDRSDHTVWELKINEQADGSFTGTKTLVLGSSTLAGALECDDAQKVFPSIDEENCAQILLNQPNGLVYREGKLFIADSLNQRILSWDGSTIEEVVKNGKYEPGMSPSGTDVTNFFMHTPTDITFDADGVLYISDSFNHRVLKLQDGKIVVVAGTGEKGFSGDFGEADLAQMAFPTGLEYMEETVTDEEGNQKIYKGLLVSDSGNNAIRRILFLGGEVEENPQVNIVSTYIGDAASVVIPQDFVSTVLAKATRTIDSALGQRAISRKKPLPSQQETFQVLQEQDGQVQARVELPKFSQAHFYFPTGLWKNSAGDIFIVDSVNNQIKLAALSDAFLSGEHLPQANLLVNLGDLGKAQLQNRVFPIVRQEDFSFYNFKYHVMTGVKDYISPYPLKHMFFTVTGIKDKILSCNISVEGIESNTLASNNFQFSLTLRDPVEIE